MTTESPWVDAVEAAHILNLPDRFAVYHKIDNGTIPASALAPRVKGGPIRISRAAITPPQPTPIRMDIRSENDLIATLKNAIRELQAENLILATENLQMKAAAKLAELRVA